MEQKLKDIKKCHICGILDHEDARNSLIEKEFDELYYEDKTAELQECSYCEKPVCDGCSEEFNDGDAVGCNECKKSWTLHDCTKCVTPDDECPFNREYSYCYECPEYTEQKGSE